MSKQISTVVILDNQELSSVPNAQHVLHPSKRVLRRALRLMGIHNIEDIPHCKDCGVLTDNGVCRTCNPSYQRLPHKTTRHRTEYPSAQEWAPNDQGEDL